MTPSKNAPKLTPTNHSIPPTNATTHPAPGVSATTHPAPGVSATTHPAPGVSARSDFALTTPAGGERPRRVEGRSRLAVVGITVSAALAWWAVLSQVAGIDLQAKQGTAMHVNGVSVFVAATAMAFAGWGLLAVLERRTLNARAVWTAVAIIACITSLGSPLFNGIGTGSKLGLASLHLIVGAAVILGLRRTALSARERCV